MDRINGLSDDLLVKILLFLPTKLAVSTSILSKRWEHLWMWLPKLEFDDTSYSESKCKMLQCFINRNLPLHKAPVIESLRLKFRWVHLKSEDVIQWIVIAVSRHVRELEISNYWLRMKPTTLPSCLYTCESLVFLRLEGDFLLDVPPTVCLPSLKTLKLEDVEYSNEESLQRLLSASISLQSLSLFIDADFDYSGLVINTPSLKYFKLEDKSQKIHSCLIENMPKLRKAYVDVQSGFSDIKGLMGSITSVKSLTLGTKYYDSEALCDDGVVFNQLKHLKLCVCDDFDRHVRFLKHCPDLQELDLIGIDDHGYENDPSWNEPTMVPGCILSNLQFFSWSNYFGLPDEKNLAAYILRNARGLKTAAFWSNDCCVLKHEMIKELALFSRASTVCQLSFDGDSY